MPRKRTTMRKIREVVRMRQLGLSQRQIAVSVGLGKATVWDYLRRYEGSGLTWEAAGSG